MSDKDTIRSLQEENKKLKEQVQKLAELLKILTKNIPKTHSLSKAIKDQDLIYSKDKNSEFPIS